MRNLFFIFILAFTNCTSSNVVLKDVEAAVLLQNDVVQLAAPIIEVDSVLFIESANVVLNFDLEGAEIFYSINEPPAKKYRTTIAIEQNCTLEVQAKKDGFIDSEMVTIDLIKVKNVGQIQKVAVHPQAHENYPGAGANAFIDLKKGSLNFRDGNLWSGFQSDTVNIEINFKNKLSLSKVNLSILADNGSWIFLPKAIEVWHVDQKIGTTMLNEPTSMQPPQTVFEGVNIQADQYKNLHIRIINWPSIPEWHAGKGSSPWLFIDEIIIE